MRVAFQGEIGAYSQEAIQLLEGSSAEPLPRRTFREAFQTVADGAADLAVVPIENSIAGSVIETQDLLLEFPFFITGEAVVRVRHCLLTREAHPHASVKTVHSHPQALAQCSRFIEANNLEPWPEFDTAGSAKLLSEGAFAPGAAAIASRLAGSIYGLHVLVEGIENRENHTRFYRVGPSALANVGHKTAIAIAIPNAPGQLSRALASFAQRNINIHRLHSRPDPTQPWSYIFHLEFEGTPLNASCSQALADLREVANMVRNFGSF